MKVIPTTTEDIPELVWLIQNSYRGEKGVFRDTHLLGGNRVSAEMIKEDFMSNPHGQLWKCVADDNSTSAIIGCVYTEKQPETNMLFIRTLCVHPDFQNAGIGKKLLKAAEERGKALKCSAITLQVVKARTALINWYERQGYKLDETKTMPFPEGKYGYFKVSPDLLAMVTLDKIL